MKTRAAIQTAHDQRLIIDELEVPDPQPDQVIVKLFSSGICHSQLHQMHNVEAPRPIVLGHEGTGVVTHVGRDVTHVSQGDHAIVTWVPRTPTRGRSRSRRSCLYWGAAWSAPLNTPRLMHFSVEITRRTG